MFWTFVAVLSLIVVVCGGISFFAIFYQELRDEYDAWKYERERKLYGDRK